MALKGVPKSPEHREKIRLARLGTRASAETRAKMSASRKGRTVSEATKALMSAAAMGRPKSAEHRANMRIGMRNRVPRRLSDAEKRAIGERLRGKPLSLDHRSKLSERKASRPPHYTKRTIEYNGTKFRSSYEVRVARACDALGLAWQYEPRCFRLSPTQSYRPDFILPEAGAIWEVKGYIDKKSHDKMELFRRVYPDVSLVVVTLPVIEMLERAAMKAA
jgi:hypothetical protein